MIRFVDLTPYYWGGAGEEEGGPLPPICAFVNTISDTFLRNDSGGMTFSDEDDIRTMPNELGHRCLGLLPSGFFDKRKQQ